MYSGAAVCTGAGSTTLPCMSLYASANGGGIVRKITVVNPTASAVDIAIRRATSTGTRGSAVTALNWQDAPAPECNIAQAHSGTAPTLASGFIDEYQFPASMPGAAMVWTYEGSGLVIPKGTANGIVVIPAAGTGQLVVVTFQWEES